MAAPWGEAEGGGREVNAIDQDVILNMQIQSTKNVKAGGWRHGSVRRNGIIYLAH